MTPDLDSWRCTVDALTHGARIDYLICDEAQFYTPAQVDQLAKVVDELQPSGPVEVTYEVLCRQHHRRRMTSARARAASLTSEPLPFG